MKNPLFDSEAFMTKREQIAAMAMQGLITHEGAHSREQIQRMANAAVAAADHLIKELSKPSSP